MSEDFNELLDWAHRGGIDSYTSEDEHKLSKWAKSNSKEFPPNYYYYIVGFILIITLLIVIILLYRNSGTRSKKKLKTEKDDYLEDAESGELDYEVDEEGNIIEFMDD